MLHKGDPQKKNAGNRLNRQFPAFILFLFFSTLIWLTIKLSGDYSAAFTFPVRYVEPPPGLILLEASTSSLTVGMNAPGVSIAMQRFFIHNDTIEVDISDIRLRRRGRLYDGLLLSSTLERKLGTQFPLTNNIHNISPDTLNLVLAAKSKKIVPIEPLITYQLGQQFMLYDSVIITPDSVLIEGFADDLKEIRSVQSKKTDLGLLKNDVNVVLPLLVPASKYPVSLDPDKVQLKMSIRRFTEASVVLPLLTDCNSEEFNIRLFPEEVSVTYLVALEDYKRADISQFQAKVRCPKPVLPKKSKLNVEITEWPGFVRITRVEPAQVEYILIRTTH